MGEFLGKAALVTGASRGIGREIARSLAAAGARVGLVARSREELEETSRLIGKPETYIFPTDLRDEGAIFKLVDSVHATLGEIDILVNAAGVWHGGQSMYIQQRLVDIPVNQIHEILEVGLRASLLLTRQLLPGMVRKQSGKILMLSCYFDSPREATGWLTYYVTNKAIDAFTAGLAAELREFQIQVNAVAPSYVATEPVKHFFPRESQTALAPQEVAQLAMFLLSSNADHISGQVIELRSKSEY